MLEGELRRYRRSTTLECGNIVFRDGACVVPCRVRDTSMSAARLELPLWHDLPDHFRLVVPMGETHDCQVVWRRKLEIGIGSVGFEEQKAEAPSREEIAVRILG